MSAPADPWLRNVPAVFRALADSQLRGSVPRPTTGSLDQACRDWGALHYALVNMLGWQEVGLGLAWWYAAGKPVEDSAVLSLVREVWGADDLIDYYAAWAWKPDDSGWMLPQAFDPVHGPSPTWLGRHSQWKDEGWWRAFLRRGHVHHHDPFYGGTDALHLSAHTGREDSWRSAQACLMPAPNERRAVLVTGGLAHWIADLEALGASLPALSGRSWRVDVFDRTVGWLGEFRRSRVTGRWFSGRHHIHMQGNQAS